MNTTWKAGENARFSNVDVKGIKSHMGVLKSSESSIKLPKVSTVAENLPTNFDSR